MAHAKLSYLDQEHLETLMMDGIANRKTKREIYEEARVFLKSVDGPTDGRMMRKHYEAAEAHFNTPYKKNRDKIRINTIKRLEAMAKRCRDAGDNSTALKVEKEITLLHGVYKDLEGQEVERVINISFKDATKEDLVKKLEEE